ncbi:phosphorelay protein [Aliivibrio sifiae]|uniref:Phosphorelay protein n=1 Tax=Aliivibrio sifiae TaxID=566293 RepID=A0ABQ6AC70_9GAMM|nr:phosphorelay protein [Aliivibrio sifiae]
MVDFENGTSTRNTTSDALFFKMMIKESLQNELDSTDHEKIRDTIHAIKGISSYGGLNRMHEICSRLENYHQIMTFDLIKTTLNKEYENILKNENFII